MVNKMFHSTFAKLFTKMKTDEGNDFEEAS